MRPARIITAVIFAAAIALTGWSVHSGAAQLFRPQPRPIPADPVTTTGLPEGLPAVAPLSSARATGGPQDPERSRTTGSPTRWSGSRSAGRRPIRGLIR
jgi:hypothetical protein